MKNDTTFVRIRSGDHLGAAYAFWFVLANKCMLPTGTVPAITKLTCADMIIGMNDQPRRETTNTLASMLWYSISVTRNKTVHREGLCDREGTVAIRIQLYLNSYLKSCIKLDYHVAKIKNKLTEFRKFWAGLCQISDSNSLHFLLILKTFWKFWRATNDYCSGWKERKKKEKTLETQKCGKRAPSSVEFNSLLFAMETNGFRRVKDERQIYKTFPQFFFFILPRT